MKITFDNYYEFKVRIIDIEFSKLFIISYYTYLIHLSPNNCINYKYYGISIIRLSHLYAANILAYFVSYFLSNRLNSILIRYYVIIKKQFKTFYRIENHNYNEYNTEKKKRI